MTSGSPGRGAATPARPARSGRLVLLVGAVLAVIAIAIAGSSFLGGARRQEATGVVVAVQATSLTDVQGFSIRAADGRTLEFRLGALENAAMFPPGHLTEHRVTLAAVRVTYVDRDGARVAVRIEDAP